MLGSVHTLVVLHESAVRLLMLSTVAANVAIHSCFQGLQRATGPYISGIEHRRSTLALFRRSKGTANVALCAMHKAAFPWRAATAP